MVEKAGTGRHMDFVKMADPGKIMEHYRGIMILEILHVMAVAFPKVCVVILYLRVFVNRWARIGTWLLIGAIVATWFSYTIAAIFQCVPFAYNWVSQLLVEAFHDPANTLERINLFRADVVSIYWFSPTAAACRISQQTLLSYSCPFAR
jgi:hypothetical protein